MIRWPFMLRSTHERLMRAAEDSARNLMRDQEQARAFQQGRARLAEVRAHAAEARLANLAEPIVEMASRLAVLKIATASNRTAAVVQLDFPREFVAQFSPHGAVLGYAVRILGGRMMQLLSEVADAKPTEKEGGA